LEFYEVLEKFEFVVFVINPPFKKKSLGLTRGKNDKIDAERICLFTEKIILNYQSESQFRKKKD
jgi:transposase